VEQRDDNAFPLAEQGEKEMAVKAATMLAELEL